MHSFQLRSTTVSTTLVTLAIGLISLNGCGDETTTATSNGTGASGGTANTGGGGAGGTGGSANGGGGAGGQNVGGAGGAGTGGAGGNPGVAFTFFATSVGSGALGGNLGGLAGADATCQSLAQAAGVGAATWRAYLSTSTVDARDRIGSGPWSNFDGDVVAANVQALHTDGLSNGNPQHMMDEFGAAVPQPEHDILTGSTEDGTVTMNLTCNDWTSNANGDSATVGHSDIPPQQFSPSWNSAHTTNGCSQSSLTPTGGSGRLYCFAE